MTDPAWREKKLRELCNERHPILTRHFLGKPQPTDAALLKHIHRELDFYEMQLLKPSLDAMAAKAGRARRLARRIERFVERARRPATLPR